jgi:hypothetical protein
VVIENLPADDPRSRPDRDWSPPLAPVSVENMSGEPIAAQLADEVVRLQPAHKVWRAVRGRTTVGLSGLAILECTHQIGSWLRGKAPPVAPGGLRFVVDDLKAYYLEAAASGPGKPSSRRLGDWLWNGTVPGAVLQLLGDLCLASGQERLRYPGLNAIVPGVRLRSAN